MLIVKIGQYYPELDNPLYMDNFSDGDILAFSRLPDRQDFDLIQQKNARYVIRDTCDGRKLFLEYCGGKRKALKSFERPVLSGPPYTIAILGNVRFTDIGGTQYRREKKKFNQLFGRKVKVSCLTQ